MAPVLREKRSRPDDARSLLRRIYNTEAGLKAFHDEAARHLRDERNAAGTICPDTELQLVY